MPYFSVLDSLVGQLTTLGGIQHLNSKRLRYALLSQIRRCCELQLSCLYAGFRPSFLLESKSFVDTLNYWACDFYHSSSMFCLIYSENRSGSWNWFPKMTKRCVSQMIWTADSDQEWRDVEFGIKRRLKLSQLCYEMTKLRGQYWTAMVGTWWC